MHEEKNKKILNLKGIIFNAKCLCERYSCNHQLDEHNGYGKCKKCDCKELLLRRDSICINTGSEENPIGHSFENCLIKLCPNCNTETEMGGFKIEKNSEKNTDPFYTREIKMATHICNKCKLVTYYEIDYMFESYLRGKNYYLEDFFEPRYY